MADEDQERFEDYLELERYIEELQAGRVAHPPANMTPERARIYNMAALFRSASPQTAEPHPDFVVSLHARLLAEIGDAERGVVRERPPLVQPAPRLQQEEQRQQPQPVTKQPRKARFVSRRSLLSGGAVAAASLVVGTSVGAALEHDGNNKKISSSNNATATPASPNTPNDLTHFDQTQLYPATTLTELRKGAVRFSTEAVIGYIIVSDGEVGEPPKGEVIAMSAACTHMGCIIQWQDADRRFHCPCHAGVFTEYGHPVNSSRYRYLGSLPRLKTHVQGDTVYIEVPASPKPTGHSTSITGIQNNGGGVTGTTA